MAVTAKWFGQSSLGQYSATAARQVNWIGDTIKVSLHTATYTPDQDANVYFSDATNELVQTGYTAGGVALASKTSTYDSASNEHRLDAADPVWNPLTGPFRIAVVYKDTGTGSTSPLLGWIDFGANIDPAGSSFTIVLDATGILKAVAS